MKNVFLFLAFLPLSLAAQTINDVPISEIQAEYLEIVAQGRMFSNKVTVKIDFGQNVPFFPRLDDLIIKDEEGKAMLFESHIDAINFMAANGFEVVGNYMLTSGNNNVLHFLMRRKQAQE